MARPRRFTVFSLSFLDVMSCGFGAVVLIFLIINHATETEIKELNRDQLSEIRMLDYEVTTGQKNLVELQQSVDAAKKRVDEARRELASTLEDIEANRDALDALDALTIAQRESLNELKSDIETREEEVERLKAMEEANEGANVISVVGEGDRQYLTGLKVGGSHVLIALDGSASMLDQSIVNVIRRRNMPKERQIASPKWQRAIKTVEWLAAQIPIDSNFQLITFNTEVTSLLEEDGWYEATDATALEGAIERLSETAPSGGTSLHTLFGTIAKMDPLPDNIYLIIDSLPTQNDKAPRRATVNGRERLNYFNQASRRLPPQVPVNVILFPMEGDPMAAASYWLLAQVTGGAFMSPSEDWP